MIVFIKYEYMIHFISSFDLLMMDSLILSIFFLPGCSPCFKGILFATIFHWVSVVKFLIFYFNFAYFSIFYLFLYYFYLYLFYKNYSNYCEPLFLRFNFYSYSKFYIIRVKIQLFILIFIEFFLILVEFFIKLNFVKLKSYCLISQPD